MRVHMIKWIYKWLPIIFGCHCIDSRSFWIKGKKFPICARCTGELVGIIISFFTYWIIHTSVLFSLILMIPMVADGFLQLLTKYESNNIKRFITGILFGYALATLFIMSSVFAYDFGISIGLKYKYS